MTVDLAIVTRSGGFEPQLIISFGRPIVVGATWDAVYDAALAVESGQ